MAKYRRHRNVVYRGKDSRYAKGHYKYSANPSGSGSWLGTIAILGGGYILLRAIGIDPLALIENMLGISTTTTVPVTTGTTVQATSNPTATNITTTNTTNSPATATSNPTTLQQVQVAIVANGLAPTVMLTFDQWNSYYQAIRGIPGPDPGSILTAQDRNENLTINEWWGYMQTAGFSGLGGMGSYRGYEGYGRVGYGPGLGGLGMVANASPYVGGYGGQGIARGRGYPVLGSEMQAKYLY